MPRFIKGSKKSSPPATPLQWLQLDPEVQLNL